MASRVYSEQRQRNGFLHTISVLFNGDDDYTVTHNIDMQNMRHDLTSRFNCSSKRDAWDKTQEILARFK